MAQLGNLLVKGSSRFLNKAYFEDVYICGDVSTGGELNIATNDSRKANLSLNGKRALRGYDSWLRINEDRHFGDGIYCGNGILRTDGEFQVGTNGNKFKVNTSSLASYVPSTFSAQATFNGGLIASSANISEEICNTLIVKDELRSAKWSIDNITNLGSTFYVSPCIIFTNPSVYVNSISGTTVVLTITDNSITSSTIGGATWTNGSKIKLMGRIGNSALGTINGVLKRDLNSSTAKTAYISLDFPNTDLIKFSAGATYSGSNVGDLKMMMYEVNKNVNGTTKNRPIGILLSSYGENKKPCIDIYNGDIEDGSPVARMGYLNGLPSVNGVNPTGYGFYAAGNAYFSGTLVSSSGKIGGFSLSEYTFLGGSGTDIIGICSTPGQEWAIWTGSTVSYSAPFRVTHSGTLYASNATIKGNITATSGKIGGCDISNGVLSITNANSTYAEFNGDGKTNGYFHIATIKITGNYIDRAMVIGAQSRGYGYSEINLQFINANSVDPGLNFFNQTGRGDWYIKKTATSTWNIYCKKSEDWGYTRILKYIDSPYVTLTWGTGNADLPSGSIRATQLAGSSAWCYNNDSTYIDGGNIYAGTVTADKITANNISGTNGWINLRSGLFDYGNGKLKWDGKSLSIAGNGKFAGEITATSGKIGKYNITNNYLISGSGSTCTGMGGNQAFWAGSNSSNDAPFHVSYDGSLYASKANISGTINSTDGSIGGWKIGSNKIESSYTFSDTDELTTTYNNNILNILSETASIDLTNTSTTYPNSSDHTDPKNCTAVGESYLSLKESSIRGRNRNTIYGIEENEENDYSFSLNAINGLEMRNNISKEETTYACNGITFPDKSFLNSAKCRAGLVAHYWNSNGVSCGTKSGNYVNLTSFSNGTEGKLSELYYKKSNYQIAISRNGVYSFQTRLGINSPTANKRVEVALFKNGSRYAAYSASYSTPVDYTLCQLNNYILYLSEGDTIDFRIAPIDGFSVNVTMVDVLIYALDYDLGVGGLL